MVIDLISMLVADHFAVSEKFRRKKDKDEEIVQNGHIFIVYNFKKATFCDYCSKILVGKRNDITFFVVSKKPNVF